VGASLKKRNELASAFAAAAAGKKNNRAKEISRPALQASPLQRPWDAGCHLLLLPAMSVTAKTPPTQRGAAVWWTKHDQRGSFEWSERGKCAKEAAASEQARVHSEIEGFRAAWKLRDRENRGQVWLVAPETAGPGSYESKISRTRWDAPPIHQLAKNSMSFIFATF
jgi:hypothetical protein